MAIFIPRIMFLLIHQRSVENICNVQNKLVIAILFFHFHFLFLHYHLFLLYPLTSTFPCHLHSPPCCPRPSVLFPTKIYLRKYHHGQMEGTSYLLLNRIAKNTKKALIFLKLTTADNFEIAIFKI